MEDELLEKIPPQSINSEQSVLGALLLDKEAIAKTQEILRPEDFYREDHKIIYNAILDLDQKDITPDLITLSEYLKQKKQLETIGGISYLTELINAVPTPANIEYYAKIVEEKSRLRSLISASHKITDMSYKSEEDVTNIIDKAENLIFQITQRGHRRYISIKEVVAQTWDIIDKRYRERGIIGIPTGFKDLDRMTSGLQPSDLIIIAGRTSMGKTALALNIATNVAVKENIATAIFSLEMSSHQLAIRMLCALEEVDAHALRTGRLKEEDWMKLNRAVNKLSLAPLFIDDTTNITPVELRGKARRLRSEHNIGLIIIDYLQLIQATRYFETRALEISEICRSLKSLARELNIPVIALSQLSRAIEKREGRTPQLSDLRESGSIEQDSDMVLFIHRPQYYKDISAKATKQNLEEYDDLEEGESEAEEARLIIAKQRNGPTGVIPLVFRRRFTRFEDRAFHEVPDELSE